jgi:phage baseplate assembly protein W
MTSDDFRGRGWRFPILPDATGVLPYVEGDANVEQSMRVLLTTALGERVMRPRFGTNAPRMVFAPGSVQGLRLLETSIRDAVRDWEPRVDLLSVTAEAQPCDESHVVVSVAYRVRRSNTRLSLVFPFYLKGVAIEVQEL